MALILVSFNVLFQFHCTVTCSIATVLSTSSRHQRSSANLHKPAGRHFDFLGFSNSSLRSQTCWFMASFRVNHEMLTASTVIQRLGDFSLIRSPAKCAARIGQAFTDTYSSVKIDPSYVSGLEDVSNKKYTFSDGVGTFSSMLWSLMPKQSENSPYADPTLYQIRFGGAKGMISLDPRLKGYQLCLRPSMIKYKGSSSSEIEICGSNLRPLPMRLNRQHIKILEDLGVESSVFEKLQQEAVLQLRAGASSSQNAIAFLHVSLGNGATQLPWLCSRLKSLGIDATGDEFIRSILSAIIQVELKDLKYRARIPVEQAVTLYGIMDETGLLTEGQIYCTFTNSTKEVIHGRVAVTRSPALHPGDVQMATAVTVSASSPLAQLHNCVVFSAKGARDLPSQLSGGDLDGDLYNVIYDPDLLPRETCSPAEYARAVQQDIGRPVEARDMTDFFVDFMKNDQLGRIATLHQILADTDNGTKLPDCLLLADLHSTAVDFQKTGIPVDLSKIPRSPKARPDFMAPGPRTKVEKEGFLPRPLTQDADDADPRGYHYYESTKVLGTLFRSINEEAFFHGLREDRGSVFSRETSDRVLERLWKHVETTTPRVEWRRYLKAAEEIRQS